MPVAEPSLADAFAAIELPLPDPRHGKVRESWALPDDDRGARRLFVTTDRLSAFDRVLAAVPRKGQVLNQLSAWWFQRTSDIVANHVLSLPDPNALVARSATPLPVEVIVRGHITGVTSTSLWRQYEQGARTIYGFRFPDGMRKNEALPTAIVTPTTKAADGGHDEPLTVAEVAQRGLVPAKLWGEAVEVALQLFARGRDVGARAGLLLADTKYEFGTDADGRLLLIDEVHTPDSSRWWVADTFEHRLAAGEEPESLDKEVVRRALADAGYRGEGEPPRLADDVWLATSARYVDAFERLTGTTFVPGRTPVAERLTEALHQEGLL